MVQTRTPELTDAPRKRSHVLGGPIPHPHAAPPAPHPRRPAFQLYFRTIFHSPFPNNCYGNGIETTVPGGPSVACSTAKAIEWDAAFSNPNNQDQSGRMVDVHDDATAEPSALPDPVMVEPAAEPAGETTPQ